MSFVYISLERRKKRLFTSSRTKTVQTTNPTSLEKTQNKLDTRREIVGRRRKEKNIKSNHRYKLDLRWNIDTIPLFHLALFLFFLFPPSFSFYWTSRRSTKGRRGGSLIIGWTGHVGSGNKRMANWAVDTFRWTTSSIFCHRVCCSVSQRERGGWWNSWWMPSSVWKVARKKKGGESGRGGQPINSPCRRVQPPCQIFSSNEKKNIMKSNKLRQ